LSRGEEITLCKSVAAGVLLVTNDGYTLHLDRTNEELLEDFGGLYGIM